MLLVIEALILISAALGKDIRTVATDERQISPLDMGEDSVDDKFYWCTKKMEHRVQTEFLKKEMSNSEFRKAWEVAEKNFKPPQDNLSKNHSVAIYVYTNSNPKMHDKFNNAVRIGKQKYKDETYEWYSLHFWLTEAIQILKKTQSKCFTTYRGSTIEFDKNVKNKEVRFGRFASSSLDREKATEIFGTKSCFEIRTCQGADLTKFSAIPDEKEVLIPPYETFKVTSVETRAEQKDPWCDTVFTLKNYKKRSFLNCVAASSSRNQVDCFIVLLIFTLLCYVFNY